MKRIKRFINEQLARYVKACDKKPIFTQVKELSRLGIIYRCIPYHYFTLRLYKKSCKNPIDYFPRKILHNFRNARNEQGRHLSLDDKKVFGRLMKSYGIPAPDEIATLELNRTILNEFDRAITFDEFVQRAVGSSAGAVFVKPVNGSQGKSTYKMQIVENSLYHRNEKLDEEKLFALLARENSDYKSFIVQPLIEQHPILESINPAAVSTIRIDTFFWNRTWIENGACLRIGSGLGHTDNYSAGGISVNIDLRTGALAPNGYRKAQFGDAHVFRHPITGIQFEGIKLPYWEEVKELVCSAASRLLPLECLGWDVAITPNGPLLIEANTEHELFLFQETVGGLRTRPIGREIEHSMLHL